MHDFPPTMLGFAPELARAVARAYIREANRTGGDHLPRHAACAAWRAMNPTSTVSRTEISAIVGRIICAVSAEHTAWFYGQMVDRPVLNLRLDDPACAENQARVEPPTHWVW